VARGELSFLAAETLTFPPTEISIKLAITIGIGMLVGLERQWSQKDLGARTFAITAMIGTLSVTVNSTATIAELSQFLKGEPDQIVGLAVTIDLLTVVAMFLRNLVILAIFAQAAVATAMGPLLLMAALSGLLIWFERKRVTSRILNLNLSSPLSLAKVLKFGLIFLII
jgi:uncharacterized membrane protein (DUF4010 family)